MIIDNNLHFDKQLIGAQKASDAEFKKELAEIQALNPDLEVGTITQEELIKQEISNDKLITIK